MSAEDFDTLLKMVKRWKPYCCWFLFQCQYYPVSLQIMDDMFIFVFVQHWTSHMKFFHYSVYCLFYTAVWMQDIFFFLKIFLWPFTWHILQKFANEHSLFNRMCSSHALPWLLTHDRAPMSHPALTRWGSSCVTHLSTLISFFVIHSGHRY